MEIGQRVYCKSDDLSLDNVQGTITRTKVLGCEDSVTVLLDGDEGKQVAFFGSKLNCIGRTGPLSKDPTKNTATEEAPPALPATLKKKVTKKKVSNTT
uniref:Uncharacterized protein n=1 Tax=viral metagenome TaxID=1070528 RepID=A0A6C0J312_9ZZZZ